MRHLLSVLALGVSGLAACAPVPIPGKIYVPANAADLPKETGSSSCVFNEPEKSALRSFGDIEFKIFEPGTELSNRDGQADFWILARRAGKPVGFAVDANRISLQDDGRQLKPESIVKTSATDVARLKFPAPSGDAKQVTLSFQPGAITVQGRPVTFAPITFKRINDPTVYLFPCLPA